MTLSKLLLVVAALSACAFTARAQQSSLPPKEVGQIISEFLRIHAAPTDSVSQIQIAIRGVLFDYARTLTAFKIDTQISHSELELRSAPADGKKKILSGCNQAVLMPCSPLGWHVYVTIEPQTIAGNSATVRGSVHWASYANNIFVEGSTPVGNGLLTGFSAEILLKKSADGEWKFSKAGAITAY